MKYACLLCVLAMVSCRLPAAEPAEPLVRAWSPLGQVIRAEGVIPIVVNIKTTRGTKGLLTIRADADASITLRQPIEVSYGEKQYEFACPPPSRGFRLPVQVSYLADDGSGQEVVPLAFEFCDFRANNQTLLVAWISDQSPPPRHSRIVDRQERNRWTWEEETVKEEQNLAVFNHCRPARLPTTWTLYWGTDLIIVGPAGGWNLTTAQAAAIRQWVRAGGRLLFGRDSVDLSHRDVPLAREFADLLWQPTGAVRRQSLGLGEVIFVDQPLRELTDKSAAPQLLKLWQQLYGKDFGGMPRDRLSDPGEWLPDQAWVQLLEAWVDLETLARRHILGLVLLFVLVCGILERWLLKRWRRLHWTWLTTPALIIVFCGLAVGLNRWVRGYHSRHSWIGIHDYAAERGGTHRTLHCLIPASSRPRIATLPTAGIIRRDGEEDAAVKATLRADGHTLQLSAPAWSPVFFSSLQRHDDPAPFAADLQVQGDALAGTVRCRQAGLDDTAMTIYWQRRYWYLRPSRSDPLTFVLSGHSSQEPEDLLQWLHRRSVADHGKKSLVPMAALLPELASLQVSPLGGLHQVIAVDNHSPVLLVLARSGPGLDTDVGPVKERQLHLYRQRLPFTGTEAQP